MNAPAEPRPEREETGPRRWRAGPVTNIVISLAVLAVPLVLLVAFCQPDERAVLAVDPSSAYDAAAREGAFPVREPGRLPDGWKATNAAFRHNDDGSFTLRVTYLTPGGRFVQLLQSNVSAERLLDTELGEGTFQATEQVAGKTWQRYTGRRENDTVFLLVEPGHVVAVVSDLDSDDVRTFIDGLRVRA